MRIAIIILIVGFLVSCNSKSYRAVVAIDKGFRIDSVSAEKRAKQIAPCITVSQDTTPPVISKEEAKDTTEEYKDTTITLPCPDGTTVSTKIRTVTYTIHTLTTVTKKYYITKTIEDKGKDIIIRDLQKQVEKIQHKRDFWMYCAIIATLLLLVGIIIYLIGKSLKPKRI